MTTPDTVAKPSAPGTEENKWLARYDDEKHSAHADALYALNASVPEDFLKVAAVTLGDGLTPDKLFMRIYREGDTFTTTPLATFRWEQFTIANITKEIRSIGWYKVTLHGRWRHGGTLRQGRIELTADHFGASSPVTPAPVSAASQLPFNQTNFMDKLLERALFGTGQPAQSNDVLANAQRFFEMMERLRPEKKQPSVEEIVDQVVSKIGSPRGEGGVDWARMFETAIAKLPQVVEVFKAPAAASPTQAASAQTAVVQDAKPAKAKSGGVHDLLPLLRLGFSSRSLPDPYAVIVADSLRQLPADERAAVLAMPNGSLVEIIVSSAGDLAPAREWLAEVEEMMRGEFEEEGGEDGSGTTANQS